MVWSSLRIGSTSITGLTDFWQNTLAAEPSKPPQNAHFHSKKSPRSSLQTFAVRARKGLAMKQNSAASAATSRRSRNGKGRVLGLGVTAGAVLAVGMIPSATAPRAHADIEDLFQPVIDAIAQAVTVADPGLLNSLDSSLDAGSFTAPALAAAAAENATVPLQMTDGGVEPVVEVSVGGGPDIPVVADTGSQGLLVPWYDIGLQNLLHLGAPITSGTVGYGGSPADPNMDVFYLQYDETVDFGNGIETAPTPVDLELFAYPATLSNLFNLSDYSLPGYLGAANADGFLGIGAENGMTPGPDSVVTALPGDLNEGVLLNETGGYLEFGPNPLPSYASVEGAPITELEVSVGSGGAVPVEATLDSGGIYGTMPESILTNAQLGENLSGENISVYTSTGQFLYSFDANAGYGPTVNSDDVMNTGYEAFQAYPVYVSYSPDGIGTMTFDY
jgi:hypothetical protein